MKYKDSEAKLKHARQLFQDAVDHTESAHAEAHRAERFYHNTEGEGQWEQEDLAYLREHERLALTFNITKTKVDTFLGMYADAQRKPVASASGGTSSDELLADVLNAVTDKTMDAASYDTLGARMLKTGTIAGECAMHIEVEPSDEGEEWIKLNFYRILPFELHWDIASIEPDRHDARYVFWDRWLSKQEFKVAYPDKAKEWDILSNGVSSDAEEIFSQSRSFGEVNSAEAFLADDDYELGRDARYYFDRHKRKIRVIRYEYTTTAKKFYALDTQTGNKTEIDDETKKRVELAESMGAPIRLIEREEEVVEVCEFAGSTLLREYENAGPFRGFSIISYCYDVDEETGTAYGLIRNLFDPQSEFNKSKSLETEYVAQSTAPGVMAEEDTISDETQFSAQLRMAGGIAKVKKGAIAEGRVIDRQPTQPNSAVLTRMQGAMDLLNEVSAIPSASNLTAAEHMQAGVTVALRHHKSRQTVSTPFSHFENSQKVIRSKVMEAIVNAMPDEQIEAILSSEGKYVVGNGRVVEMMPAPQQQGQPGQPPQQGQQMVPRAMAELRGLRSMKYNLDMEYTTENSTLRMLELDMLLQLAGVGVPIDPDVMVERATSNRSIRERLKRYVEETKQAQAEGAKAQSEALQQQNQQYAAIEMGKIQESSRHNRAQERLEMSDQQITARLKHLEIWEKADDMEKKRMIDVAKFAIDQTRSNTETANYGA